MIKLSYSTHGLPGDLFDLIDTFEKAGYEGVELAFQEGQLDPRNFTLEDIPTNPFILKLRDYFKTKKIKPACINTATLPLIPGRLHEPTVISLEEKGRQQRIEIIQKGIEIAKVIGAPIVGFGSGFIREEHVLNPSIDPWPLMIDSIQQCLKHVEGSDVTLVIEPEPGMMIETLQDGIDVVKAISSENFKLHIDLCHAYCSDHDYIHEIEKAASYTKYLHISDTGDGYNLKIVNHSTDLSLDLEFAAYLIHYPKNGDFLLIDKKNALYFYTDPLTARKKEEVEAFVQGLNGLDTVRYEDYQEIAILPKAEDYIEKQKEIKTYLLSMPRIAYETLDRANPILHYLRGTASSADDSESPVITQMVANSLTGKVHFHDIPGKGEMDFKAIYNALNAGNFSGYGALELYHHGEDDVWQDALNESMRYLSKLPTTPSQKKAA